MRPYRYTVRTDVLKPINKLEIRVSNTAANQYVFTKELDKYTPGQIGPYHATTKTFEKESVDSGLYGPVRFLK